MEFKDYYKMMGLTPEATADEIKRAYRKLARKYHPDVSQEKQAEEKFKELGEAYEVLKDPEKKSAYDRLRTQGWRGGETFNAPPNWHQEFHQSSSSTQDASAFSDFFESLFGGQQGGRGWHTNRGPAKGEDVRYLLEISLEDSFHGASRVIEIPITTLENNHLVQKMKAIKVKIPKGVIDGQHIRLKGQGSPGIQNGPAGDLYLEIRIRTNEPYHLSGRDITIHLPVSPWEAALGAKVKVPTLGGNIELKIPANSQTGAKLRLKGRGLPGKDHPGDEYVILQVVTPPAESQEAKALYQQMAEKIPFNPRAKLGV